MRGSLPAPGPPGRVGAAASGRGPGRRTPMPCDAAYGLLPGLGAPGRRLTVLGDGAAAGRGAPGRGADTGAGRGEAEGADGRVLGTADAERGVDVVDGGAVGAAAATSVTGAGAGGAAGAGVAGVAAAAGLGRAAGAVGVAGAADAVGVEGAADTVAAGAGWLSRTTGAGAAVAWGADALAVTDFSRTLRTTGASSVDEADRTNSPMSFSVVSKSLLSSPSSLASSQTRTLAMISFRSGAQRCRTS